MKYRFEKYWRTCEVAEIEAQSFEEALEIVKKRSFVGWEDWTDAAYVDDVSCFDEEEEEIPLTPSMLFE